MNIEKALRDGFTMEEINAELARRQKLLEPVMAKQPAMQAQFIADEGAKTFIERNRQWMEPAIRPLLEYGGMAGGSILGAGGGLPTGPGALATGVAGGALGYGMGKNVADQIFLPRSQQPQGVLPALAGGAGDVMSGATQVMAGEALGPAVQAVAPYVKGAFQGTLNALGNQARISGFAPAGGRVAGRGGVLQPGAPRVYEGLMTADEAQAAGLQVTGARGRLLNAATKEEDLLAQKMAWAEDLRASDPSTMIGRSVKDATIQNRQWVTDFIKGQLGIEGPMKLTPSVIGQKFSQLGKQFDDYAAAVGNLKFTPEAKAQLSEITASIDGNGAARLKGLVQQLERAAKKNGGEIPASTWQQIRSDLGKEIKNGAGAGQYDKAFNAGQIQTALDDMLHAAAGPEAQAAIAQTRSQYRILKTLLSKEGNISKGTFELNPDSFMSGYLAKSPSRFMNFENDPIGKAMKTYSLLTTKFEPSSGTAQRLLANPVRSGMTGAKAVLGLGILKKVSE